MFFLKQIISFFDHLEDHVREALSRYPIVYTLVGGFAIVLFWRGVWMTADYFAFLTGPVSIVISVAVLLVTGLFVSFFISDRIIVTGLQHERKLVEKAAEELKDDTDMLAVLTTRLDALEKHLTDIKNNIERHS